MTQNDKQQPFRIALREKALPMLLNRKMNRSVLAQKPYTFRPTSFVSQIEGLKPKSITQAKQLEWFDRFMEDPFKVQAYCLVSAPNDGMAKLLAAYMMQQAAAQHDERGFPLWHDLTASFANPLLEDKAKASLLVLNNVGTNSTPAKMEKLRDLLEFYADIPRIVIATGCDPFYFFTKHLYLPLHACAYMTTNLVKKAGVNI